MPPIKFATVLIFFLSTLFLSKICFANLSSETEGSSSTGAAPSSATPKVDSDALNYLYNRSGSDGSVVGTASDDYRRAKSEASLKQNALEALIASESTLSPAFERFLSTVESDRVRVEKYQNIRNRVLDLLNKRQPVEAWQLLFSLKDFEWDAQISSQIANRVRAIWDSDASVREITSQNQKLKIDIQVANWNADSHAATLRREQEDRARSKGAQSSQATVAAEDVVKNLPGTLRMTEEYFKSLDSKARIKLNEIKLEGINSKARADLEGYITTLFKSRSYEHAILAGEFYQALFTDGQLPTEISDQITAAYKIINEISESVEVVRFKIKIKHLSSAMTILSKAWELGDNTPPMLCLERPLKLTLIEHANNVRRMRNLIEARDFDGLERQLTVLEERSLDFDTIKPRSLINAIKLDSIVRLGKARLYAQQGNSAKALDEFKAAAEIWPGNPDLTKASNDYFLSEDTLTKLTNEFDREIKEGNFRNIASRQAEFLQVANGDDKRKTQLKDALERVRGAEVALEKGRMQSINGDWEGAWETIEVATLDWPEDRTLNRMRSEYSGRAVEFVSAIKRAQFAEDQLHYGASMSLYALARSRYPLSQLAKDGLRRTSGEIFKPIEFSKME